MTGAFSYPRSARILNKKQYNHTFKKGVVAKKPAFIMYACSNQQQTPRLGIICSKKSATKAVDRNRIKRLCKNSFRLKRNLLLSKDFVILARPKAKYLSNEELVTCLNQLLDKHQRSPEAA